MTDLTVQRGRERELRLALREIREALDADKQAGDEGRITRKTGASGYPPSLEVLVEGVEDIKNPKKAKIYFLRRLPRDPFSTDREMSAEAIWGKRSYASPANKPREGDDVFDIYTLDRRIGSNGGSAPRMVRRRRLTCDATETQRTDSRISPCCSSSRSPVFSWLPPAEAGMPRHSARRSASCSSWATSSGAPLRSITSVRPAA